MVKIFKKGEFWVALFIIVSTFFIYKDVFLKDKVAFPSNFLAFFYSPWATHKFEAYPYGVPHKPIGGNDQVRVFYPYRVYINELLSEKELPLWNPYNFSGSPLIANFQSAVFYPLNLIYLVLPLITAWSLMVIIQPLLGTFFMYLYLRQFIPQKIAVFLGAVAFGFSGFILAWSQENAVVGQTALWLPLILMAVDKYISTLKFRYYILLVFSLSSCFLAGHLQPSFYVFFMALIYGVFRLKQNQRKNDVLPAQARRIKTESGSKNDHLNEINRFWSIGQNRRLLGLGSLFLSSFLVSLFVCAIQLFPSIEAFGESARSASSINPVLERYLLPITDYIKVFASDIFGNPGAYNYFGKGFYHESVFYIGIIPLVFAVLAIRLIKTKSNVKFFFLVTVLSILFGVKSFFTQWFYTLPIPIVNTFTPSRIFFLTSTSLAILSSYGLSYWLKVGTKKTKKVLYFSVFIMAAVLIGYVCYHYALIKFGNSLVIERIGAIIKPENPLTVSDLKVSARNLVLPLLMLLSLVPLTLLQRKIRHCALIIVFIFCLGQFYFLNKYVVIGDKNLIYPDHFIFTDIKTHQSKANRFLSFGLPILGNVGLVKHVYSPDGIDPVFPKRYGQLALAAKQEGRYEEDIPRIEVAMSEYGDDLAMLSSPRQLKLISLLGVTRVYKYKPGNNDAAGLDLTFPQEKFKFLWSKDGWQSYENTKALPRVFLVDDYMVEKEAQKILDLIFDPKNDLGKTVILEEEPDGNFNSNRETGNEFNSTEVILKTYKPHFIDIQVNTDKDRILFISDNYYPGWKAKIDNVPTKIYRANYTFRALVVPEGKHTITFMFKPMSFFAGAFVSVITLLALAVIAVRHKMKPLRP